MRRSIALAAMLALLGAATLPAVTADAAPTMACCRGTAAMACCLPAHGGAMKSCPAGERDSAGLPGLPPAVLAPSPASTLLVAFPAAVVLVFSSPGIGALSPPDQPPRA